MNRTEGWETLPRGGPLHDTGIAEGAMQPEQTQKDNKLQFQLHSQEQTRRLADWTFSEKERCNNWKDWNGEGAPPWWIAGAEWVWTVVEAFGVASWLTNSAPTLR